MFYSSVDESWELTNPTDHVIVNNIAVDSKGNPWFINEDYKVARMKDGDDLASLVLIDGVEIEAYNLALGDDGSLWIVNTEG